MNRRQRGLLRKSLARDLRPRLDRGSARRRGCRATERAGAQVVQRCRNDWFQRAWCGMPQPEWSYGLWSTERNQTWGYPNHDYAHLLSGSSQSRAHRMAEGWRCRRCVRLQGSWCEGEHEGKIKNGAEAHGGASD